MVVIILIACVCMASVALEGGGGGALSLLQADRGARAPGAPPASTTHALPFLGGSYWRGSHRIASLVPCRFQHTHESVDYFHSTRDTK